MCWRHERASGVSSVFMIVLVIWTVWGETCEDLQCQNSNPCQSYVHQDNRTQARCVCAGRWAGHRCQHHIRLQPQTVTSSHARLKVDVMTSGTSDVAASQGSSAMSLVSAKEKVVLNYTLVYWRRNDTMTSLASHSSFLTSGEVSCVLLHNRNSRQPVLRGLLPSTRYTICVENGFVDSCVLASFTEASSSSSAFEASSLEWPSNCVTIYTPRSSPHAVITQSSTVTLVAAVSIIILAFLVIVFIVFLVRRQNLGFRLFLDSACCKLCCMCQTDSSSDASQDRRRLSQCSSQLPRSVFLDENMSPDSRTHKKSFFKRLKTCQKEHKSSTYTSASMLLAPPPSALTHEAFIHTEDSPLGFHSDDDDSVFENSPAALAVLPVLRNKPRHRLSRKRRGYVTYSTRKDKNIRLTTVLESPMGDNDGDLDYGVLGCGHSSI